MPESAVSRILGVAVPEPPDAARAGVPPYHTQVFVPAHPRYPGGGAAPRVDVELLRSPTGPPVPVAFTSLTRLVEALGDAQPWIAVSLGPFAETMRDARLPQVRLDPTVDGEGHHWDAADLVRAYGTEGEVA